MQKRSTGSAPASPHELLAEVLMMKMLEKDKPKKHGENLAATHKPDIAEDDLKAHGAEHVGTTAVCVLFNDTDIICANAGDSRAILCRGGKCMELSKDHKPCLPDERKRILSAGGTVDAQHVQGRTVHRVNQSLSLSRSIGDLAHKKTPGLGPHEQAVTALPQLIHGSRSPKDEFLVLACDGIWDVMTSEQVTSFVRQRLRKGMPPKEISHALIAECLSPDPKETKGLGTDNMTCIIVVLAAPPPKTSITNQFGLPTILRNAWCGAPNPVTKKSFREGSCERETQAQSMKAQKPVQKTCSRRQ